ncbi:MAG TPA: hypothetical protein VN812_01855, partial [Candidatus Acidoferrales bacterium]|nr:hypothetical protein [Candidatus Acidoferrales bacterium]
MNRRDILAVHAEHCDECRTAPLPLDRVATLLNAGSVDIDTSLLSRRVLARLTPQLQRRAAVIHWRRVAACVLLALVPLPVVLAYDAYVLHVTFEVVSVLLPATLAAYLVLSYAAFLLLLFALTYASIPLLMQHDRLAAARG